MQKNNELNLKALEEKLEAAKKDTAIVDQRNQQLQSDISRKEIQKVEKENEFAQAETRKKEELCPLIDECEKDIQQLQEEISHGEEKIVQ